MGKAVKYPRPGRVITKLDLERMIYEAIASGKRGVIYECG